MTVWNGFKILAVTAACLAVVAARAETAASSSRPHIFLILSDDVTKLDLGVYGNRFVRTPRLDRLAREGMLFHNVFATSPSCTPSRTSLYTGLYPFRNGAHPNHSAVKPGIKSLPHYLKHLGYRVILLGKTHIRPPESFPFEYYPDLPRGNVGPGQDLRRILADPGDKPLCIVLCKFDTHWTWPHNRYGYDPDTINLPPYHPDTPETRELRANYYSEITEMDAAVGKVLDLLKEHRMEENTLTIWTADHGSAWPHERQMIYDAGTNSAFIARWPGHITPGSESHALISYVDILPTLIEVAGGEVSDVVSQCGGESLDGKSFLPVLLGEKNQHHSEVYTSFTWVVMQAYPMRAVRTKTHKYIWNIDSHFMYPNYWAWDLPRFQTKWRVWKSWVEKGKTDSFAAERVRAELFRPPEELYDIRVDPHEMSNLADDPAHQELLASLRWKLRAWMKQQGDAGDSAYHKEAGKKKKFMDEIFCRQPIVNVKMKRYQPQETGPSDFYLPTSMKETVRVEMTSPVWTAEIRYTLDGGEPTRNSTLYTKPFLLDSQTTIKAKGFWEGGETAMKEVEWEGVDYRFHYEQDHLKPLFWP